MYDYDDIRVSDPFIEIMSMLYQARDAFVKAFNAELEEIGINYSQAYVLIALKMSNRPLAISELSHILFREIHSVSELVTRMEKRGYLEKVPSVEDKRYVRIQLAPKGIEIVDEIGRRIPSLSDLYKRIFAPFSPKQLKQFNKYLRMVRNQAIQEVGMEITCMPPHISMDKLNKWLSLMQDRQSSWLSRV